MLEKNLQKKILQFCKTIGILAFKVESQSTTGFPDLLVIKPCGKVYFIEVKTETGRLSKMQKVILERLEKQNANAHTIYSFEQFVTLITAP